MKANVAPYVNKSLKQILSSNRKHMMYERTSSYFSSLIDQQCGQRFKDTFNTDVSLFFI